MAEYLEYYPAFRNGLASSLGELGINLIFQANLSQDMLLFE